MKQNRKIRIDVHVEFDSTVDAIIQKLQEWKQKYGGEYDSLYIEEEPAYDGGYNHHLVGHRLETDEEEKNRLILEERYKNDKLAYEKKEYERLKAKFENNEN